MSYVPPNLPSSYAANDLGRTIYDFVRERRPHAVVEFGSLHGYSAACIGQAMRDNGFGTLVSYDLWEDYPYRHGDIAQARKAIDYLGLTDFVEFRYGRLGDFPLPKGRFALMHLDVSNTGDTLRLARELFEGPILFEGGTHERDNVAWMAEHGKAPIVGSVPYDVIDTRFPSISLTHGKKA